MTRKQIKKEAYRRIVKEGQPHQEVYDSLKTGKAGFDGEIASDLSRIPSQASYQAKQTVRIIFLVLVGLICLIRVLSIVGMLGMNLAPAVLLIALIFGFVAPAGMIYSLVTKRMDLLRSFSGLLLLGLLRNLGSGIGFDVITIIILIVWAGAGIVGLLLPSQLKCPVNKRVIYENVNGKKTSILHVEFEEKPIEFQDENILDA